MIQAFVAAAISFAFMWPSFSFAESLCTRFAGTPSLRLTTQASGGLREEEFNSVLAKIDRLYREEFRSRGGTLVINNEWSSDRIDARANEIGWLWMVSFYGGLARQPLMTRDAFVLTVCHEIGHHLGGSPNKLLSSLASEGEADYYATLKCARRFFADEDNRKVLEQRGSFSRFVGQECKREHAKFEDRLICVRSALAAKELVQTLQVINGDQTPISFATPDRTPPSFFVLDDHPRAQCRLDTFLNGARCSTPVTEALSENSYWPGTCDHAGAPPNVGSRPRCWFSP